MSLKLLALLSSCLPASFFQGKTIQIKNQICQQIAYGCRETTRLLSAVWTGLGRGHVTFWRTSCSAGLWGKESRETCAWVLACPAQAVFHSRAETCKVAKSVCPSSWTEFYSPLKLEMSAGDKNKGFSHDTE